MNQGSAPARLGPIKLAAGVTRGNGVALVLGGLFIGILAPFINFAQPYILTEHLGIPKEQQGTVSGDLAFWTEIVLISLWESMAAVRAFAGENPERSVYYPEDDQYLLEMEPLVRHYEVAEQLLPGDVDTKNTAPIERVKR